MNKHFVENAADRSSEKKIPSHGAAVKTADAVETQTNSALIVDAFMMYTNETLADYFGRLGRTKIYIISFPFQQYVQAMLVFMIAIATS